jgi:hypothetical protein
MRARSLAALAVALASASGCVYAPVGSCSAATDCAAGERCDGGVCVADASPGGGTIPGADPDAILTTAAWSALDAAALATFRVDSVGADLAGNVYVAGTVSAPLDPWAIGTGAFVARRAAAGGGAEWAVPFPTFSHGRLAAAALPDGGAFFAGTAFEPTTVGGVLTYAPPPGGALVLGRLAADGTPLWARAVAGTDPSGPLVPAALAVTGGGDLLVAGTGSGDFGRGDTRGAGTNHAFVARLAGGDGSCLWSRGLGTRTISDVEARGDGGVAIAGVCTPAGASFDPGAGTTCARGLFLAGLGGADGTTEWARTTSGPGTVSAVRDLAVAPDGRATVVGDARGAVSFGGGAIDLGGSEASFAATFDPQGAPTGAVLRAVEAPWTDAVAFSRGAYDAGGRLWLAGRYTGAPALGGIRFTACRPPGCGAAAFLARLDPAGRTTAFLPILAAPIALGGSAEATAAWVDDLALFATTGTVAHALRFTGRGAAPGPEWPDGDGALGLVRIAP